MKELLQKLDETILNESPIEDALIDVEKEGEDEIADIAKDYGLSSEALHTAWIEYRDRLARADMMTKRADDEQRSKNDTEASERSARQSEAMKRAASKRAPAYVLANGDLLTRIPVTSKEIMRLGIRMQAAAGESFPEGDPHDLLAGYFRQKGWDVDDAFQKLVPMAARNYLNEPTYDDYLRKHWDDIMDDMGEDHFPDHKNAGNPYGERI